MRAMARLLVTVLEQFSPGALRTASKALCMARLAARLEVSQRELQRFIAVLRTARLLETIQPPGHTQNLKSKKGRCYNVWLLMRAQPRELAEQLEHWRAAHRAAERTAQRDAAAAPPPKRDDQRTQRPDAAKFAAMLAAKYVPPE